MTDNPTDKPFPNLNLIPASLMTPLQATVHLQELSADKAWGERLTRGDDAARREFDELSSRAAVGDPIDWIMQGVVPNTVQIDETNGNRVRAEDMITFVADQRERGIPDSMTREVLSDVKPTLEQHKMGKELQRRNFADAAWVERLKAGDPLAVAEFQANSWAVGCYEPPA